MAMVIADLACTSRAAVVPLVKRSTMSIALLSPRLRFGKQPALPHHISRRTPMQKICASADVALGSKLDVKGDMLAPSPANKNWVRAVGVAAVVVAGARGTGFLPAQGTAFVHLLAVAAWLGSSIWVTFIAGITMFRNMPRQLFGKVQAVLFPQYFALHAASAVICAGCLVFGSGATGGLSAIPKQASVSLAVAVGTSLINLWVLEPAATKVMFERYALENAPVRDDQKIKALYKQFGKYHGSSSLVNLVGMLAGVAYAWWLAGGLAL